MSGLDWCQFRDFIVRPALTRLEPAIPWTLAAERLVLGTALYESDDLRYIDQLAPGPGPAFGPCQMERPTHDDLWRSYISMRPALRERLLDIAGHDSAAFPPAEEMHGNHFYAVAMCRVHYRRVPEALPAEDDALGMAKYYKRWYNTIAGKATVERALPSFMRACGLR